jgi:hypothetical protein
LKTVFKAGVLELLTCAYDLNAFHRISQHWWRSRIHLEEDTDLSGLRS